MYVVGRTETRLGKFLQVEGSVTSKYLWCGVLLVALGVSLSTSAEAQTGGGKIVSNGTIAGVVVGVLAAVAIVA